MLKNEPKAVVDAIREIMKNSSETAQETHQVAAEKLGEKYKTMKPVQEIFGVLKAMDKADKANQEVKKQKAKELVGNQHKLDKNKNGKLDAHDFKLLRKEEAEQTDEARHSDPGKRVLRDIGAMEKRAKPSMAELDKNKQISASDKDKLAKTAELMKREKAMKEEAEIRDEKTKTIVKRAKAVYGKGVETQGEKMKEEQVQVEGEENLDEARFKKGQDVGKPGMMFGKIAAKAAKKYGSKEAGQRVAGAVLKKVLAKKAMKEETEQVEEGNDAKGARPGWMLRADPKLAAKVKEKQKAHKDMVKAMLTVGPTKVKEELDLEEGRGRPRKNPNDPKWQKKPAEGEDHEDLAPDSGKEADQHIHVRLKQAADSSEKKGSEIKFDNGKTHFVHQHVAQRVLSSLDKMKPDVRAKVHDHIQKSHENLMQVHTMLAGKK